MHACVRIWTCKCVRVCVCVCNARFPVRKADDPYGLAYVYVYTYALTNPPPPQSSLSLCQQHSEIGLLTGLGEGEGEEREGVKRGWICWRVGELGVCVCVGRGQSWKGGAKGRERESKMLCMHACEGKGRGRLGGVGGAGAKGCNRRGRSVGTPVCTCIAV